MKKNDSRFESIFEILPVPTWEEDFSEIKSYLEQIGLIGKDELQIREYFKVNFDELKDCTLKVKVRKINKACLDLHDASSKQELIENFPKIFAEDSWDILLDQIVSICQGKSKFEVTTKTRSLNGQIKDIDLKWSVVPGFEDCLSSVIITTIDITSRIDAEKALLERNSFIETTLEHLPIGVAVNKVKSGEVTLMNKTFSRIYGWPANEINTVKSFFERIFPDPEERHKISSQINADLESNDINRMYWNDIEIATKEGKRKFVSAKNIPVFDQDIMISTVIDETKRKQSEDAIIKKTKYLECISKIVESLLTYEDWDNVLKHSLADLGTAVSADRVCYLKNSNDPTSEKLIARQVYEWCKEGITPQIDKMQYQEIHLEHYPNFLERALNKAPYAAVYSQAKGTEKELLIDQGIKSIILLPIYFKNTFFGFIGFDDCTKERVWSEDEISFLQTITSNFGVAIEKAAFEESLKLVNTELKESNKNLALSNSELEQFAYVASHDLQEPLRMITSFLALIERKYHDKLDEKGKSYIHFATDGAKRMRNIILDLLEFSRIGKVGGIENQTFNSKEALIEVEKLLNTQIRNSQAIIISENLPNIYSKKTAFQQLLQNLISNAIKYQNKGNQPIIHIKCEDNHHEWLFSVKDNGMGIAPHYFEKIFVIFQRLHDKNEYSGSGIGLAICKKIVEYLGGKIWVESKINVGSTFYFSIPKIKID